MAAIVISSTSGVNFNPTSTFLPFYNGTNFADSLLSQDDSRVIKTISNSNSPGQDAPQGLLINNADGQWTFGDIQGELNGPFFEIIGNGEIKNWIGSQSDYYLNFADSGNIKINNTDIVKVSAGVFSNRYLQLIINGTTYKIALLNNTL